MSRAVDRRRLLGPEQTVQPVLSAALQPTGPLLDEELKREDVIKKGIITRANGSAYVELGNTKLTCAVYGPRSASGRVAASRAYASEGSVNCEIEFLPFSSFTRRPYQRDNEEAEMSALLEAALEPAVRRDLFPNAHVDIFVSILQDDGSILPAAILAAATSLAQAQIEMYDSVVACSALVHESTVMIDPTSQELAILAKYLKSRCLLTCAVMPNLNRITQIHSLGPLNASLYQETLNMLIDGSKAVYQSTIVPALLESA